MSPESMRKIKGLGIGERAVIGKLKKVRADEVIFGGGILFFERRIEASDIASLPEDAIGLIVIGENDPAVAESIRARNISAIFIGEEQREMLRDGERAVLYPDRNTLFIAPQIEIVDDFSMRINSEEKWEKTKRALGCREYFSDKVGVFLIVASEEIICEEDAFRIYSDAAQECGFLPLIILIDLSFLKSDETLSENLRAIIRATVYTKIIPAFGVSSLEEFESMKNRVKSCARELSLEGREVPQNITCGVIIKSPHEVVCIDSYSSVTDFVVIDLEGITADIKGDEIERAREGYLGIIQEKMSRGALSVIFIGDRRSLEICAERLLRGGKEEKRSYFMIESGDIKIKRNKNEKKY